MGKRYVPKTYNNRRLLRIVVGVIVSFALMVVVLFLLLFFALQDYYIDGRLEPPWFQTEIE